jgi:hypothetical protein
LKKVKKKRRGIMFWPAFPLEKTNLRPKNNIQFCLRIKDDDNISRIYLVVRGLIFESDMGIGRKRAFFENIAL